MISPEHGLPLLFAMLAAGACRGDKPAPAPAPTTAVSAAPLPSATAPSTVAPPCHHRRPFSDSDKPLVLPPPFAAFTPCDVVKAILGQDPAAGDKVRIDHVRRWDVHGRTLLAALYYRGGDAEGKILRDTCRVTVHLGVVERRGDTLVRAARAGDPGQPGSDAGAMYGGRADFDAEIPFDATEALLAVRTPWTTPASGTRTRLTLYRLVNDEARAVFDENVGYHVDGTDSEDDHQVTSTITAAPRPDGANDLSLKVTERRCHYDQGSLPPTPICRPPKSLGTERWRFGGAVYERASGKPAPPPRAPHRR